MSNPDYSAYSALEPFFAIIQKGLADFTDGDHFWDLFAEDAVFEFLYEFPEWPPVIEGRAGLMRAFLPYGDDMRLNSADHLVIHPGKDPRTVVLEYEVHGTFLPTGAPYNNRFASIITIESRKVVHWRDYMDSLAAYSVRAGGLPGSGSGQ
jgi:ketosteroid isomerase-like protein